MREFAVGEEQLRRANDEIGSFVKLAMPRKFCFCERFGGLFSAPFPPHPTRRFNHFLGPGAERSRQTVAHDFDTLPTPPLARFSLTDI